MVLVAAVPTWFALASASRAAVQGERTSRREQCGVAYLLSLRQILERLDPFVEGATAPSLDPLRAAESQLCSDPTLRAEVLPLRGGAELLSTLAPPTDADRSLAFSSRLTALIAGVRVRSGLADDPDLEDDRRVHDAFMEGLGLFQRMARGTDPDTTHEAQRQFTAVERDLRPEALGAFASALAAPALSYRVALRQVLDTLDQGRTLAPAVTSARSRLFRLADAVAVAEHALLGSRTHSLAVRRQLLIAADVALVLALLGALVMGLREWTQERRRRVLDLVDASRRTARGELGLSVQVRGHDGVTELERAFNEMTAELRGTYERTLEEIERARASEEAARRYLRHVTDSVPGAIFELVRRSDGSLSMPFVSEGYAATLGVAADPARPYLDVLQEAAIVQDRAELIRDLRTLSSQEQAFSREFRIRHGVSGETRWIHLRGSAPQRSRDGLHRSGIFTDVTDQKKLEGALAAALDTARIAEQMKTDFLQNVSHEIRTPMNAILGLSHLALQTALDPVQRDYVVKVHDSAKGLVDIINDILDFSKLQAGTLPIEEKAFTLADVVAAVERACKGKALAKGLDWQVEVGADVPPALIGDGQRLGQILQHFAANAVKFTDRGRVLLSVQVLQAAGSKVELGFAVTDSGSGIAPAQLDRLFQTISQGDGSATRRHGGTGLGLVVAKQLADLLQGDVGADSQLGVGSTFWLRVAFRKAAESAVRSADAGPGGIDTDAREVVVPPELRVVSRAQPFDPGVLDALTTQIQNNDSEAVEAVPRLREMEGADPRLLDRFEECLRNFSFEEAEKLLPALRTAYRAA